MIDSVWFSPRFHRKVQKCSRKCHFLCGRVQPPPLRPSLLTGCHCMVMLPESACRFTVNCRAKSISRAQKKGHLLHHPAQDPGSSFSILCFFPTGTHSFSSDAIFDYIVVIFSKLRLRLNLGDITGSTKMQSGP